MFAIQTQREWRRFCAGVMESPVAGGRPALRDERRPAGESRRTLGGDDRGASSARSLAPRCMRLARARGHRDGRGQRRAGGGRASAARGARAVGDGRVAGRRDPRCSRRTIFRARPRAWAPCRRSASTRPKCWPSCGTRLLPEASHDGYSTTSGRAVLRGLHGWAGDAPPDRADGDGDRQHLVHALTVNTNPIHFDAHYSSQTEFGQPLDESCFTLALVTGLSVADVSQQRGQPRLGRGADAGAACSRATRSTRSRRC